MIRIGVYLILLVSALLPLAGCATPLRLGPFRFSMDQAAEEPAQRQEHSIEEAALSSGLSEQDARELARILETTDEASRPLMTRLLLANMAKQRDENLDDPASAAGAEVATVDEPPATQRPRDRTADRRARMELSGRARFIDDSPPAATTAATRDTRGEPLPTPATASLSDDDPDDDQANKKVNDQAASQPDVKEDTVSANDAVAVEEPSAVEASVEDHGPGPSVHNQQVAIVGKTASLEQASGSPLPAAKIPTRTEPNEISWQQSLQQTIRGVEQRLANEPLTEMERMRAQAHLGLLNVIAEDPERAVTAFEDLDDEELEFWRQTTMALDALLASNDLPRRSHRVELATDHLRSGVKALATLGPLRVRNLAFCTKVSGFGDFREFESYTFPPGQQVLLYVEIEDFAVEQVESVTTTRSRSAFSTRQATHEVAGEVTYKTELHARYEILDENQRRVATKVLPVDRETCRNHRQDYYIPYLIYLPTDIQPGHYKLELVVEDKKGIGKVGFAAIDFQISK
jgi:hypothetical protein